MECSKDQLRIKYTKDEQKSDAGRPKCSMKQYEKNPWSNSSKLKQVQPMRGATVAQ